jgi:hypothetical protein
LDQNGCVSDYRVYFTQPIPLPAAQALIASQLPSDASLTKQGLDYYINQNYPEGYCATYASKSLGYRFGTDGYVAVGFYEGGGDQPFDPGQRIPMSESSITYATITTHRGMCGS